MQISSNLITHLFSSHRCSCMCAGLGDWPGFSDMLSVKKKNQGSFFHTLYFNKSEFQVVTRFTLNLRSRFCEEGGNYFSTQHKPQPGSGLAPQAGKTSLENRQPRAKTQI